METKEKVITPIPATLDKYKMPVANENAKRRACGYARVSTDKDEQFSSYAAQIDYYTKFIKSNPKLKFVGVYTDEGITGTSTIKRKGFTRMIKDALNGKIDLIITKSISRFARNTVDTLVTIRKLKEKGIEVYFEKENIYTLDSKGELLITIMSSIAQEESRSISENILWSVNNNAKKGTVHVPFGEFVGFDRGEEGKLVVNHLEAALIRRIYNMSLERMTSYEIAKELTKEGVPTPQLRSKEWYSSTIKSILTNEKYIGDALLRKTYCTDFLTKKRKKNEGEITSYYVTNSHEAIVDKKIFENAKKTFDLRKYDKTNRRLGTYLLQGRVWCPHCRKWYGYKLWHVHTKNETGVWLCNGKYKGKKKCDSPNYTENELIEIINNQLLLLYKERKKELMILFYHRYLNDSSMKYNKKELTLIDEELKLLKEKIDSFDNLADKRIYKKYYFGLLKRRLDIKRKIEAYDNSIGYMINFLFLHKNTDEEIILFMWRYFFDYISIRNKKKIIIERDNSPYKIFVK